MNVWISKVGDLTIPAGQSISNIIDSKTQTYDAEAILIVAPGTLDAGTYNLKIGDKLDGIGASLVTLQDETGTDYVVPAANKGIVYSLPLWPCFAISGPSAAADRVFKVFKFSRG